MGTPTFDKEQKHNFDLEVVHAHLVKCCGSDGQIKLRDFLNAYHELCRFFKLTGKLFGFVAKDLEWKISVIEAKMSGTDQEYYRTVQSMVEFEVNNDMAFHKGSQASGTRTLLRLQWALEFILEFMNRVRKGSDDDSMAAVASDVYSQTLSKHHPWLTKKMAAVAVYFLPSRKSLITVMCKQDYDTVLQLLDKVVHTGKEVYTSIDEVYTRYDLQCIP